MTNLLDLIERIDEHIADLSKRTIVPTADIVDLLLDLRNIARKTPVEDYDPSDDIDRILGVGA